jgi:TonB family protein
VSAIIHLALLMALISYAPEDRRLMPASGPLEEREKVFLPSQAELKRLLVPPAPRTPTPPRAVEPPPPAERRDTKDRVSIGPPIAVRQDGPMILRREDDLTKTPKGRPDGALDGGEATATPAAAGGALSSPPRAAAAPTRSGSEGFRLPPGIGRGEIQRRTDGDQGPLPPGALAAAIDRSIARRLQRAGPLGLPSGTGKDVGAFHFDPQGADFTAWINHGKNEIYRNWLLPQSVLLGFSGAVTFEFTVERDGRMSSLSMLKSSGTPALDRAARNGLTGARWLPLPDDYGPAQLTLRVTFIYGNAPQDL